MKIRFLLTVLLLPTIILCQWNENLILKLKPVNFVVTQSPSFEIEKVVYNRLSVSLDFVWKRHLLVSSGQEYDFGTFRPCNGFKIGISPRYYFGKKRPAPFGWFVAGLLRYNSVSADNIEKKSFKGEYVKTINLTSSGMEGGILFGRQFKIWRLTTDLSAGLTVYDEKYTERIIDGNVNHPHDNEGDYKRSKGLLYLGWTIGYNFSKLKKENASQ